MPRLLWSAEWLAQGWWGTLCWTMLREPRHGNPGEPPCSARRLFAGQRKPVPLPAWTHSNLLRSEEATEAQTVISRPEPCPYSALSGWGTSLDPPVLIWKMGITSMSYLSPTHCKGSI